MRAPGISIASPTRVLNLRSPIPAASPSPRSILKRPPPLHLSGQPNTNSETISPLVLSANVTIIISPSKTSHSTLFTSSKAPLPDPKTKPGPNRNRSTKTRNPSLTVTVTSPDAITPISPHVHFPPSAHLITATFDTHSSECYDRSAIKVSPNALEIPSWGTRVYSPTIGGFRGDASASKVMEGKKGQEEDNVSEDEDDGLNGRRFGSSTRLGSPFTPPIAGILLGANTLNSPLTPSQSPFSPRPNRSTRASIKFQNITALNSLDSLQPLSASVIPSRLSDLRHDRGGSLTPLPVGSMGMSRTRNLKFPRSPYPNVPISPRSPLSAEDLESYHTAESDLTIREEDVLPLSPLPSAPLTSTPRSRSMVNLQSPSPRDPFAAFPSFSLVLSETVQNLVEA